MSNRIKKYKALSIVVISMLFTANIWGQEFNYARLSILYGGNVNFNFNSIRKISEGIEIADGTVLGVTLVDSNQVGTDLDGFDLNFRSFNNQANIEGDANNIALDRIQVMAENELGLGAGTSDGYVDLQVGWNRLFNYNDNPWGGDLNFSTHQIAVSYQCGMSVADGGNGTLLGEAPDYYTVEVEIRLVPTGLGF